MTLAITSPTLDVELAWAARFGLAHEQNAIPLAASITLFQRGSAPLADLAVELQLVPGFGEPCRLPLPLLAPGERVVVDNLDFALPAGALRDVREAERAVLRWQILAGEARLAAGEHPVEVLPFNHWTGDPRLLAAYVQPNDPALSPLLQQTAGALKALTGSADLDGYQARDPVKVLGMARALYDTLQGQGLAYLDAPASFHEGQKIRLAGALLAEKQGCCLDVATLVAGCYEAMGLAPFVLVMREHAFAAVWLVPGAFCEGVVYDAARLRNEIALGHLLAVDSSTMVADPPRGFDEAVAVANRLLEDDQAFEWGLDVKMARRARIRPLSLRAGGATAADERTDDLGALGRPTTLVVVGEPAAAPRPQVPDEVRQRFERWQERLLDLSLRNRLLSFNPEGKGGVALEVPDLAVFEDLVALHRSLRILPWPDQLEIPGRSAPLMARRGLDAQYTAELQQQLAQGAVLVQMAGAPLVKLLKAVDYQARTAYEEGGAHALYIAVGVLAYHETPQAKEPRYAPLLLYPVQLTYDRAHGIFSVRRTADDPLPNVTLIEKLKRDFDVDIGALAELDADEGGLDVGKLLRGVRTAILGHPRWEVLEKAYLGLFSFSKFLMWRDLQENREDLMRSPVVRHLASQDLLAFRQQVEAVPPQALDDAPPVPTVVDADSTQLAAVASALAGRSFVLQGPPGTGKSQTITNMIAALLAAGKRVLFVSEKMAALEVVQRRLAEVGLADFVLELHDPETDKKQVLGALKRVYQRAARTAEVPWEARNQELGALRARLNEVARALQAPRPLGLTFHQAMSRFLALAEAPEVRVLLENVAALDGDRLRAMTLAGEDFARRAVDVQPVATHAWQGTAPPAWSAKLDDDLKDALEAGPTACGRFEAARRDLGAALGLAVPDSVVGLAAAARLATAIAGGPLPPAALGGSWEEPAARIQAYVRDRAALDEAYAALGTRWPASFLVAPAAPVAQRLARALARPFWLRLLTFWGERKRLRGLALRWPGSDAALYADLNQLAAAQAEGARLAVEEVWWRQALGEAAPPPTAPLAGLAAAAASSTASLTAAAASPLAALAAATQRVLEASRACQALGLAGAAHAERWNALPARAGLAEPAARALAAAEALTAADATLLALLGARTWPGPERPGCVAGLAEQLARYRGSAPSFRHWCFYTQARRALESLELAPIARAHAEGRLGARDVPLALERTVLHRWLVAVRDAEPALAGFDGDEHERWVAKFRAFDQAYLDLSRRYVVAQLEGRLPRPQTEPLESSEPGILLKEESKSRKQLPLRKLFGAIPKLVRLLKPCFMMSPLSIARYLPAGGERFDVVIFDEASQLSTHDAVGAIARGNQVIVVGDSKQLPPTSFFQRKADDDGVPDENDIVELESVLEEAIARQMPQQMLGWHYRSKHDALIDFSNRHYYNGELTIFPAASRYVPHLGLKHHLVPHGVYLTGRAAGLANTNPEEARALVDHLVGQLLAAPAGERTFGIVTFSMAQQTLIRDYLDDARQRHPAIEPHFTGNEALFVKNLENVQGDERDEIYFSICYARDADGKLRMNFGPLSLEGGERRLNVAVTRARCLLRVFATLTPDQIDVERARAVGARHLKQFLADAQQQGGTGARDAARLRRPSDGLATSVRDFLVAQGFEVHAQIGCGDYRLELAVADPARPGQYVLGVETDGPHYGSAATARDRDRIRQQVLRAQGWRLTRVWGLDWWSNRAEQEQALLGTVRAALAGEGAGEEAPPQALPSAPTPTPNQASNPAPAPAPNPAFTPAPPAAALGPSRPYVVTALAPLGANAEDLYAGSSTAQLRQAVASVLATEAPIHADLLCRRVMAAYGVTRLTDAVRRRILAEAPGAPCAEGFFGDAVPTHFRVGEREPEHWPPEETALALAWVLEQSLTVGRDAALREVARQFGLKRVGKTAAAALERGVALLVARGRCREAGDQLEWIA